MLSPSLEDYLEELYRLSLTQPTIRITDIAECLNVSKPSVVKGLRKLDELDYIRYRPYEKIVILEKGKKRGKFLVDRNRIMREFVSVIGSNCDVKDEAEAMEHFFSLSTVRAIEKLIIFFQSYPHILEHFLHYEHQSILDDNNKQNELSSYDSSSCLYLNL